MRFVIPVWGACNGSLTGAGPIDAVTDEGPLPSMLGTTP